MPEQICAGCAGVISEGATACPRCGRAIEGAGAAAPPPGGPPWAQAQTPPPAVPPGAPPWAQGPPPAAPPTYGQPAYGQPAYGPPPYGQQSYGPPTYGSPPYGRPGGGRPGVDRPPIDHPDGTTVLVLGLVGLLLCSILGPFAWSKGNQAMREIDANPGRYRNRGMVQAGRVLGIITSCFLALLVVGAVLSVVLASIGRTSSSSTDSDTQACLLERRTLATAAEAYRAENGSYPTSEDQLVGPYLNQPSSNFDLEGGPDELRIVVDPLGDCG